MANSKNGIQYALFPTQTRDDKTYATIALDFGTAQSLMNKGEVLDLTAYLLFRASAEQSLQDITDKIIESGGGAFSECKFEWTKLATFG